MNHLKMRNRVVSSLASVLAFVLSLTSWGGVGASRASQSHPAEQSLLESHPAAPRLCNGSVFLCDRRFNQIAWMMSHNATSLATEGSSPLFLCRFLQGTQPKNPLATQTPEASFEQQLRAGVRAFKIPIMVDEGVLWACHPKVIQLGSWRLTGSESCRCDFARRPLPEVLQVLRNFLIENPREVIALLLDNYASTRIAMQSILEAGLEPWVYAQDPAQYWPTLGQLIEADRRLVVFNSLSFAALDPSTVGAPPWLNSEPDFIVSSYDGFYIDAKVFEDPNHLCPVSYFEKNKTPYFEISGIYSLGYHGYSNWLGAPIAGSEKIASEINPRLFLNATRCSQSLGFSGGFIQVDYVDLPSFSSNLDQVKALNEALSFSF